VQVAATRFSTNPSAPSTACRWACEVNARVCGSLIAHSSTERLRHGERQIEPRHRMPLTSPIHGFVRGEGSAERLPVTGSRPAYNSASASSIKVDRMTTPAPSWSSRLRHHRTAHPSVRETPPTCPVSGEGDQHDAVAALNLAGWLEPWPRLAHGEVAELMSDECAGATSCDQTGTIKEPLPGVARNVWQSVLAAQKRWPASRKATPQDLC
jgi:hypothetical protein